MKRVTALVMISACGLVVCATARLQAQATGTIHDISALQWMPAAVPGLELAVVEGNPQGTGEYIVAMRYKAGTMTPPHSHPAHMHLVVVRGQFVVGFGDQVSTGNTPLEAGSVVDLPQDVHHYEGAITDAVVLIYGPTPMRIDLAGGPAGH